VGVIFPPLARWEGMAAAVSIAPEAPGDAELISAVRAGDTDAYGELFARHVAAARRLARQLVAAGDVDDLVSEAFAKVLAVLQRGGGPDLAFRAYLLTAVRRLHVDRLRSTARLHTTDDLTPFDPGVPFRDTAVEGFESAAAARAFASLPERWQLVLWHTEIERQKPAEVATLLGISANSVSALAYRAREGLRQAYLSMHAADIEDDACARTRAELGAYVRGGLGRRDAGRVEAHLEECRACAALYLELTEVNSRLGAVLAPALLGGAAAAYLAGAARAAGGAAGGLVGGGPAGGGGVPALLDRAKDAVAGHLGTVAVAGAAAAVVAGGLLVGGAQHPDLPVAGAGPAGVATASAGPSFRPRHGTGLAGRTRGGTGGTPPGAAAGGAPSAGGVPARPHRPGPPPATGPATTSATTSATAPSPSPSIDSSGSSDPPDAPGSPASTPPTPPLARVGVLAGAGPDGVSAGVRASLAGTDLPPVDVHVPLGAPTAGGLAGGLPGGPGG
jgi:RNA polymerase sigma factor (sigma-70 family)